MTTGGYVLSHRTSVPDPQLDAWGEGGVTNVGVGLASIGAPARGRALVDDLYGPNEFDETKIPVDQIDYVTRGFR